ncbi:MAG: Ig-like domain-containing protein, partial [Verrucomicrobia bacterium]|nr:Ig-like domain-containing protein [Verrucomicrobiota bacterium]
MKLPQFSLQVAAPRLLGVLSICLAVLLLGSSRVSVGVEPLSFVETPAASSFFTASITNTFDDIGVAQADDWTLEAEAGDRLTVRLEAAIGNARPKLRVLNPSGQTIASVDGGTTGMAETYNLLLSVPGTFRVRVYTDHQVSDYRLRVDFSRGPTLEVEPNDSIATAKVPEWTTLTGSYSGRTAGTLTTTDSGGDYFNLGVLDAGNSFSAELFTGEHSTLQPGDASMAIFRQGDSEPLAVTTNASLVYGISEEAVYFVRIQSDVNRDLFARYLLTATVTDTVAPSVESTSLPGEGTTSTVIFNAFTVTFSEDMDPATINNPANFSLRAAGVDEVFGTGDDEFYPLASPFYMNGTVATFALVDGPLQPGNYRFTIAATVTDRASNPLAPSYTLNFTIDRLGFLQFEARTNDTRAAAGSLSLG